MAKILIFDTECNGLDTENGFIQEIAWGIFDTITWRLLSSKSFLINWPTAYEVSPEALQVTSLSKEFCWANGVDPGFAFGEFLIDLEPCDYICGHNVLGYDIPMLSSNVKRAMLFSLTDNKKFSEKLVIDTLIDCPFPAHLKVHSLKYLAFDHKYIMSDAHQALADVMACKHILSCYDFETCVAIAKTPLVTLTTKIDFNDIESRERVKNARFYWDPKQKLWVKRIREYYLPGIQLSLGDSLLINKS